MPQILHVQAGSPYWEPSQEELNTLADMVTKAVQDTKGATIVTTQDVFIKTIQIEDMENIDVVVSRFIREGVVDADPT